jgi:hypothetical protein
MSKSEIGFWLLIIGVLMLAYKKANTLYTSKVIVSSDNEENWNTVAIAGVAAGSFLLWPKIR